MNEYHLEVNATDERIRKALKEVCGDLLVSIIPVSETDTRCNSVATINAHDDFDFAQLMIDTGRLYQRLQYF